ncbi:PilZ domain-containing protein [Hydrogenivirga sp.]
MGKEEFRKIYEEDRDFFIPYREKFAKNFVRFTDRDSYFLSSQFLSNVAERIYSVIFLSEKNFQHELTEVFNTLAPCGSTLRLSFLRSLLAMAEDYIGYLALHLKSISKAQLFLEFISACVESVEEAYRNREEHLKRSQGEISFVAFNFIKELVKRGYTSGALYFTAGEESVIVPVSIDRVLHREIEVRWDADIDMPENPQLYLLHKHVPKPIKVLLLSSRNNRLKLVPSGFGELDRERRRFIRVVPDERIEVVVVLERKRCTGTLTDVSMGGAGISVEEENTFELLPGRRCSINFRLPGGAFACRAVVRHVRPGHGGLRLGLEFENIHEGEDALRDYLMQKQVNFSEWC